MTSRPIFAAIGVFDGVHRGHQNMLKRLLVACAGSPLKPTPAVITFSPAPKQFFRPNAPPDRLTTLAERLRLLNSLGFRRIFVLRFDRRLSNLTPGAFVEKILVRKLRLRRIFVGYNFGFGKGRAGNAKMLKRLCERHGIQTEILPPQRANHRRISATAIRRLLKNGNLAGAERLLGYPYLLTGRVVKGSRLGSSLTFPTANLRIPAEKLLPQGVFAATVLARGRLWAAAANIGLAPTMGLKKSPCVEAHLPQFRGSLLGETVNLYLRRRLRDEIHFSNGAELRRQIRRDIREVLSQRGLYILPKILYSNP